jgi:hypothetical protein
MCECLLRQRHFIGQQLSTDLALKGQQPCDKYTADPQLCTDGVTRRPIFHKNFQGPLYPYDSCQRCTGLRGDRSICEDRSEYGPNEASFALSNI